MKNTKDLGHILDASVTGLFDINYVKSMFNKSLNVLLSKLGNVSSNIVMTLFNQSCCSSYGLVLGDIQSKIFIQLFTLW